VINRFDTMEKPFLLGNLKLDEAALRKIFIYNLNKIYPILLHLENHLPELAGTTCYGDLQNAILELTSEVNIQATRIDDIFLQLKEVPVRKVSPATNCVLQVLVPDSGYSYLDGLSKDLSLVFHLQKVLNIKKNYFYILKSIAGSFNNINIKQHLQYSCDECEDNQLIFKLIAKEYMESSINPFLV
jgi:hypothetical protein